MKVRKVAPRPPPKRKRVNLTDMMDASIKMQKEAQKRRAWVGSLQEDDERMRKFAAAPQRYRELFPSYADLPMARPPAP